MKGQKLLLGNQFFSGWTPE